MQYYFAPMEGLTDSIYRRLHREFFSGVDRYYMPFLSPTVHRSLTHREDRELPKAGSVPFTAVPQLLTKVPEDFLWAAEQCRDLGYEEVNLNLGCPSGTVTAKGKGSGMLRDPEQLSRFLDAIFGGATVPISVKTRLGFETAEEFPRLLEIFNQYPIKELTLHPRVRKAFYTGDVDMDAFRYCLENSKAPVCYNGNLCSVAQIAPGFLCDDWQRSGRRPGYADPRRHHSRCPGGFSSAAGGGILRGVRQSAQRNVPAQGKLAASALPVPGQRKAGQAPAQNHRPTGIPGHRSGDITYTPSCPGSPTGLVKVLSVCPQAAESA